MNKLKSLFLLGLVAISSATFVSCEKNNNDDPSTPKPSVAMVKPASTETSVVQGGTVDVQVLAAAADAKLKTFKVQFSTGGGPFADYGDAFNGGTNDTTLNEDNYTYYRTLPTLEGTGTITYKFIAIDKDGNEGSTTLKINVTATPGSDINAYSAKLMGGQSNTTYGSFMDANTGVVYKIANAKANAAVVDLVYYYGATNLATFAAPDDADAMSVYGSGASALSTWSVRNATKFEATTLTEATFNGIDNDLTLTTAYGLTNPANSEVNNVEAGDVLRFLTVDGKKGFVLVKSLSVGGSGSVNIDVKIEK